MQTGTWLWMVVAATAAIALIRSVGARLSWLRRLVSNHTRIEYCCWLSSRAWPTPAVRLTASVTLMVR